jgi:pilus assembly protein CpaC
VSRRALRQALAVLGVTLAATHALAQGETREPAKRGAEARDEITLAIGETTVISAREVRNYSLAVAGIVDIKLTADANQFVLVGRKQGSTTLLLIKNDGSQNTLNVTVFPRPPALVERELAELLAGLNVQSRRVGAQIVLDGAVASESDLRRVQQIAALYPDQVTSLVQVAQSGSLSGAAKAQYLVRIDFYFIQYDKESSYALGVGWPESIGSTATATLEYDFLANATRSATATIAAQPLPRLDIAARRGWAKVLKQATVITNNDAEAHFSNGGEQNFPVNTGLTIGVERIGFGTELTVLPHFDPEQRELGLRVVADVSDLAASVSGSPLPGRTTSRLTTVVNLKLGQSLVLSGIRTESLTHAVTGLPGLSDIPLLGFLFGSHSQSHIETEGAILVVPSVVQSVPSAAAELVELALQRFKKFDGDLATANAYDKRPGGSVEVPR